MPDLERLGGEDVPSPSTLRWEEGLSLCLSAPGSDTQWPWGGTLALVSALPCPLCSTLAKHWGCQDKGGARPSAIRKVKGSALPGAVKAGA